MKPGRGLAPGLVAALCAAAPANAQCPDGTPPPCGRPAVRAAAPAANSIAVLYFENASRDTADQYLADGITEEITTSLGRIERLRVVSPAAVRRALASGGGDLARVARLLGVRNIVEGSLRRAGGQARITARLLGADARTALWTDAYTRPTADLLALEEEIAQRVASGVVGTLLPAERRALASGAPVDPVAHDHVLRGNFQLARRSPAAIRLAIGEYDAAIARDSSYARAWGRLALGYSLLRFYDRSDLPGAPAESMLTRGERAAARALRLDSTLSDPWGALAGLRVFRDPLHMAGALEASRRAVALDPRSADAHHALGVAYQWRLDTGRARLEFVRALELEPGRLATTGNLAAIDLVEHAPAAAVHWADSAVAINPDHWIGYRWRAMAYAMLGDSASALRDAAVADRLNDATGRHVGCLVAAMVNAPGRETACRQVLVSGRTALDSAAAWFGLGNRDRMYAALDAAIAERMPFLLSQLAQPWWDPVRSDPRFARIIAALRPAEDSR